MDSLKAAMGSPRSVRRRTSRLRRKSIKKNHVPSLSSSSFGSSGPPPPLMNDHKALTAYIMDQMAMMQLQQQQSTTGSLETPSGTCPSLAKLYTSYLPNFMWYQPTAADSSPSSMIRPTSLCSGTGITGDHQYLQPDMLNMFRMFGSYFVGSGHLFQDDEDDDDHVRENKNVKNKRRSAFWVETIDENDGENDSIVSEESTNSSYDESTTGSDCSDTTPCQIQKELIEKVIEDLRCSSQMMIMDPRILTDYKIRDK